jgi:integrase
MATNKIPATNPDQFCIDVKPAGKVQFYSDPKAPGLRLRVKPTGSKAWIYGYSAKIEQGKYASRSMSLGPLKEGRASAAHALTVKQARDRATELRAEVKAGGDPAVERKRRVDDRIAAEAARLTVADVFEEWMKAEISKRKDGGSEARRMMEKDVLPVIGGMGIDEVRKLHVANITAKVQERGDRIAHVVFSLIRQMMAFAVNRDYIEADPSASIKKSKVGSAGKERERILEESEIRELFRKLPDSGMIGTTLLAVPLQLSTCCRIGELLQARWADVDFDQAEWFIPESKNGKAHTVHLSAFALDNLRQLHTLTRHTPWLYPNRDETNHVETKAITKQIRDRQREVGEVLKGRSVRSPRGLILESGKGERWTPHDLRRTGASIMAELGVLPDVVERCLNHTEENKVKRTYQRHEYRTEMAEAWDLLGNRLALLANPHADNVTTLKRA